jgi:RNA polymerase sigma-70 factor (ECF subfamily)
VSEQDRFDRDLVRGAKAGDAAAFDLLVERHTPRVYRVVRRMASDRAEAEAIVQEAWLRAWRNRGRLDETRDPFPWLARIAVNVARDAWKKRAPTAFAELGEEELEAEAIEPGPEERLDEQEELQRVADLVQGLRPVERAVIALRYDAGLSYEAIATSLQVPVNTVRTHLRRAKARLRRALEANGSGSLG